MNKRINKDSQPKYYMPNADFAKFLDERIDLIRERNEGKTSSDVLDKKFSNSNRMKNHWNEKLILPSIANLIYFLEKTSQDSDLKEWFSDEISDFADRADTKPIQLQSNIREKAGITLRRTMLIRLLGAILDLNQKGSKMQNNAAKLRILHDLQGVVFAKMFEILRQEYGNNYNQFRDTVLNDIFRALSWIIFANRTDMTDYDKPYRKLKFDTKNLDGMYDIKFL